MQAVTLRSDFPGANPGLRGSVEQIGPKAFCIRPFDESGYPAYQFRLDIRVEVASALEDVDVTVDWNEPLFRDLRKRLYVGPVHGEGDWRVVEALSGNSSGPLNFRLRLPKGEHHITLNPRYDFNDLERLAARCDGDDQFSVRRFRAPGAETDVVALEMRGAGQSQRPVILAVARVHPYETAGSYCLEGIVRGVLEDGEFRFELLRRFDWIVVPILASRGVADGCCRLNGLEGPGVDLSREWKSDDPSCWAIAELVRSRRVVGYLDIHNWMHPGKDGLRYVNRLEAWRFKKKMNQSELINNEWRQKFKYWIFCDETNGVMNYIKYETSARCLALEYPWYNRDPNKMCKLGKKTALAFQSLVGVL